MSSLNSFEKFLLAAAILFIGLSIFTFLHFNNLEIVDITGSIEFIELEQAGIAKIKVRPLMFEQGPALWDARPTSALIKIEIPYPQDSPSFGDIIMLRCAKTKMGYWIVNSSCYLP